MITQLRAHREIILILACFVLLGTYYSITTPLFEAPDEQWHFAFVQHVATGRGLPVQSPGQMMHLARQEGSQPPLYYLLASAATFWIDTSDYPGMVWENPHYGYNVPGIVDDNKNLFVHTALENWPYHGAALAIHLARLLSVLMGALAALFTYGLALEIFPGRPYMAACAAALAGFVPQFLFVSAAVSNDSTIVAMAALSLWLTVCLLRVEPSPRAVFALGVVTGLAALAKVSGAGLVVLAAVVLLYTQRRNFGRLVLYGAIFGLAVFAVAGWWYLRNWFLYGELTGTAMMVRIFGARESPLTFVQLWTQLSEVWETFWVGFGWGNIRAHPLVYILLQWLAVLSGIGLLLGLWHRRGSRGRDEMLRIRPMIVLGLWILLAFAELIQWMQTTQAPHGRLLFPILPALAPLAVFGLAQWMPARVQSHALRAVAVVLAVFAALAPVMILQPAYAYPAMLDSVPNMAHRVDINYADQVKLLGYDVSSARAAPGSALELTLYWQGLAAMDEDYTIGIHLVGGDGRVIGTRDSYPGHGLLPTRLWRAGQIMRDTYWLPISADAVPGIAQLQIALYSRETKRELAPSDPAGRSITPIVGRLKITGTTAAFPQPANQTSLAFGGQITLIGYDLASAQNSPGLVLYWKRTGRIAVDYTVFIHILDSGDNIIAQQDRQPGNGENPTSLWDDGEVVRDAYDLSKLPRGAYRVELGLYRADSGERLPVLNATGNTPGDHVMLGSFEVRQ